MTLQDEHPAIHHWLVMNTELSTFARNVLNYASRHGGITDAQLARVEHMIERETRRHRRWMRKK